MPNTHAQEVLNRSPVLFLRLGESTGTTATDAGTNGLNGTYSGTFTLGQADSVIGDGNTAALISQTTGKISVPHNTGLNLSTQSASRWSIEWLEATATNPSDSFPCPFSKGSETSTTAGSKGFEFFYSSGSLFWKGGNAQVSIGTLAFSTSFKHIIVVWDGTHLLLYKDGSLVAGTAVPTATTSDNTSTFNVNQTSANTHPGNSTYDEIAVYSTALTSTDVTTLFGSLGNAASIVLPETGTGTGALTVSAAVPLAQPATGTDALTTTQVKPLAETATGTGALTVTSVAVTLADGLSGFGTVPLGNDPFGGVDRDALTLTGVGAALAQPATGTDALTVSAVVVLADTGTATQTLATAVPITLPGETGAFTDALTVPAKTIFLADAGAGTDALFATGPPVIAVGGAVVASPGIGLAILASPGVGTVLLASSGAALATLDSSGAGLATVTGPGDGELVLASAGAGIATVQT